MNKPHYQHLTKFILGGIALAVLCAYSLNATLIYDDLWIITLFKGYLGWQPDLTRIGELFSTADLKGEYRLYGLSKVMHWAFFQICGTHAWAWGLLMGATQLATTWMLYRLLRNYQVDHMQSVAVALTWLLSPFAFTSCFHHFSYLILPCQITIACALILQNLLVRQSGSIAVIQYLALIVTGLAIAWTGESHLILAGFFLTFTGVFSPSTRSWSRRAISTMVPIFAIFLGVLAHRTLWTLMMRKYPSATPRFQFTIPEWSEFSYRAKAFLHSIPDGISCQIKPILLLAGWPASIAGLLTVLALTTLLCRTLTRHNSTDARPSSNEPRAFLVSSIILLCLITSISVTAGVGILSNLVMDVLPRRYGYIPFTMGLMLMVSIVSEPRVRRRHGNSPMVAVFSLILTLWLLLQLACLPVIRSQDRQLWNRIRLAAEKKDNPSILFINAWNNPEEACYTLGAATPALRNGIDFPEIFESPFTSYWWVEPYARLRLKIPNAGFRADQISPRRIRLRRGRVFDPPNFEDTVDVPLASLVVVADSCIEPPQWNKGLEGVEVISDWKTYKSTLAASGGTIVRGWQAQFPTEETPIATIDLGLAAENPPPEGILPDKRFDEPWDMRNSITNYGWQSGTNNTYKNPASSNQLSYYNTNRNGSFVYGIEFSEASRKYVYLDFMELWLSKSGIRSMNIEANYGDGWMHVAIVDPFAISGRDPFSIRLIVNTQSFQIRLSPTPGAADIPFINGIRVYTANQ